MAAAQRRPATAMAAAAGRRASPLAAMAAAVLVVLAAAAVARTEAYTVVVGPHVTSCFHQDANNVNDHIAFSFAVQAGGNFDIDWLVKDPTGVVIHNGNGEKEGDFIFTVDRAGEFTFCFSNAMSTFVEKTVNFEIALAGQAKRRKPAANADEDPSKADKTVNTVEESVSRVRESLVKIERSIRYYKTREKRNFDTASQTESRLFWTTVAQCVLILSIALFQVFVLRSFFNTPSRKGRNI